MTDSVRWEVEDAVATITMDRPQARNALNTGMKEGMIAALNRVESDPQVRAVVLTGAGNAFCAGQDLREHADRLADGEQALDTVRVHYNPIITAITTMPKPVIAAIRGSAAGAGAAMAFACDFRIATREASFLMAFARIGLGPDSGASWTLQRLAGAARATELLMLAEPIGAGEALAAGLLTAVVGEDEFAGAVGSLARRLAAGPTAAYAAIKEGLLYSATSTLADALENEARLQGQLAGTTDHREATAAFLRKEQPRFRGR